MGIFISVIVTMVLMLPGFILAIVVDRIISGKKQLDDGRELGSNWVVAVFVGIFWFFGDGLSSQPNLDISGLIPSLFFDVTFFAPMKITNGVEALLLGGKDINFGF